MPSSKLSHLAETLKGSEIVKLGADVKAKMLLGEKIYNFTIGDFDSSIFPIPEGLQNEIVEAYKTGFTTYPPAEGIAELRQAIAEFIQNREGVTFAPNEILIAAGGRPLIYAAYRAIVDKGDKVIYAVPSWNNNHYVHFTEGEHVVIESKLENNFMPSAAEIKPHLKGSTLLALCSPSNPTGTTFTKIELEEICDIVIAENATRGADERKLYLIFDQMYWTLTFGTTEHFNPVSLRPAMKEFTVFIDGISKSFAATGVRVGWAMGPESLINKMKAINSHVGSWAPMAEQKATAKFLVQHKNVDDYFINFKAEIAERLDKIYAAFIQLKGDGFSVDAIAPQAAIYLTIQIDLVGKIKEDNTTLINQAAVTAYLLDEAKLALVPFTAFGASADSSWYRMSVGTCKKEEIVEMMQLLKTSLQKLK